MKIISAIIICLSAMFLTACGSIQKTTTTKYDAAGNVSEVIVNETDASDFSAYIASGDGNATTLSGDISKFSLGFNGYGLSWFSVSAVRVKAPVNEKSNAADALEKTAEIISATKVKVQTADLGVNTEIAAAQ